MQLAQKSEQAAPSAPVTQSSPKRMTLANVQRGKLDKPIRIVMYGTEGIGKSTFAGEAPDPIFLCAEDGTKELDVARFPEPKTWEEITEAVETLRTSKHSFKTFVLDTLDWAEPLCWDKVCRDGSKAQIEDFGYGAGYTSAVDMWRVFLSRLDALCNARAMHVILIAHAHIKKFQNPEGNDFDRYEMALHAKSARIIREWCDAMLFARLEVFTHEVKKKTKGVDSGARIIHTSKTAAFDAKNRYSMPSQIPLNWDEFYAAAKGGTPATPEKLQAEIAELLEMLDAKTREKGAALVVKAGDDSKRLAELVGWLRGKLQVSDSNNNSNATKEQVK
jgi:AAA domain